MTKLFVGNLASNRTPNELRRLFQTCGSVAGVEIMTDPETRYSRGFAYVEMTNDLEAKKAISDLNGVILWGKPIRVEDSRQLSELDLIHR
ncbi:MAG: RNA-binding protein [Candidatus Sulfotelmatobacter sp.]